MKKKKKKKKKRTFNLVDFVISVNYKGEKKKQKDGQIFGLFQRVENAMEHEGESNTNCSLCS